MSFPKELKFGLHSFSATHVLQPVFLKKVAFIFLALATFYLASSLIWPLIASKEIHINLAQEENLQKKASISRGEQKPYEFYSRGIAGKKVFATPVSARFEPNASVVATEASSIKDLSVNGIISGDNPQAIIEDKIAQKTYYMTEGQTIGKFKIEKILDGKIILTSEGQRYELNL